MLFGQCPNRGDANLAGASLKAGRQGGEEARRQRVVQPLARAPRYLAITFFKLVQNMVLLKEEPWCSHNQCGWMWAGRQPGGADISEEKAPVRPLD